MSGAEMPRVSVVVPFFNSEQHLAACIESLLTQEDVGGPYEVILVNNGSEDASPSIVERYKELIVLEESRPGAYAARNTGIRAARAPLLAFTDADCIAAPDWLHTLQEGMEDPGVGMLLGHFRYPEGASPGLRLLGAYENIKTEYVVRRCPREYHFAYANNMAVRASLFEELGPFKEWRRAADSELVHRMGQHRPDLRLVYHPAMRVTHMEFLRAGKRVQRLSLYTQTNSKIQTFRELGFWRRLGLLGYLLRRWVGVI
jgi:glycosyltransferase involved in cell wall biosynthesis